MSDLHRKTKSELISLIRNYQSYLYALTEECNLPKEAIEAMQDVAVEYGMTAEIAPVWSCQVIFRGQAWSEEDFKQEMERLKTEFMGNFSHLATGSEDGNLNEVEIGSIYRD